ncbi:hypothetical protein N7U66_00735 [Lacinutrix neustonica]|uniref:Uncharacterized protein n=1 Tax=Lacinutrix neustonica TaxID=2980107 RepID=A0A9E8MWQ9_9FLAO|nr:hypothetical protein [Lacinutrix neustonica]WAC02319.1 hypothetical protein N7U66_00735 [Lacinutrix neustonica]
MEESEYKDFNPNNVLVIGVTPDLEARNAFESQLKTELYHRDINALQSAVVFESSFIDSKQTETEIENQIDTLLSKGYDTVIVSTVKGVDDKMAIVSESKKTDYNLQKFKTYYLLSQNVYFDTDYYENYKVYHIETSIYNLKKDNEKALIWVGYYDIIDPENTKKTVDDYVKAVVKALEKERLIPKITTL